LLDASNPGVGLLGGRCCAVRLLLSPIGSQAHVIDVFAQLPEVLSIPARSLLQLSGSVFKRGDAFIDAIANMFLGRARAAEQAHDRDANRSHRLKHHKGPPS
jgi:hypothetical protein